MIFMETSQSVIGPANNVSTMFIPTTMVKTMSTMFGTMVKISGISISTTTVSVYVPTVSSTVTMPSSTEMMTPISSTMTSSSGTLLSITTSFNMMITQSLVSNSSITMGTSSTEGIPSNIMTSMDTTTLHVTSNNRGSDSSVGIIVGCVIGIILCVVILLLVIILVCCLLKRKKAKFVIVQGT